MHQMSQATTDWFNEHLSFMARAKTIRAKLRRAQEREDLFFERLVEAVKWTAAIALIFDLFVRPFFQWLST
jgi:hypothetical protein